MRVCGHFIGISNISKIVAVVVVTYDNTTL